MAPTRPGPGDVDHPLFQYPRDFNRETENRPFFDDSDDFDSESSDDESDSESGEGPDDEAIETGQVPSAVRRLSRKRATDKPSPDSYQDAQVVQFVEYGLNNTPEPTEGNDPPLVALIDDQTDTVGGQPCRGGLTRSGLEDVLEKQACTRFQLRVYSGTDCCFVSEVYRPERGVRSFRGGTGRHQQESDVSTYYRNKLFHPFLGTRLTCSDCSGIPGLAAQEMEVIAANATTSQKGPLLKFFRYHINPSPLIECDMPVSNPQHTPPGVFAHRRPVVGVQNNVPSVPHPVHGDAGAYDAPPRPSSEPKRAFSQGFLARGLHSGHESSRSSVSSSSTAFPLRCGHR